MQSSNRRRAPLFQYRWPMAGVCWLLGVLGLWYWMTTYQFSTDDPFRPELVAGHRIATSWPSDSSLALSDDGFTLLFFVHPKCPCTRASSRQLQRLLDGNQLAASQHPRVLVIASHPLHAAQRWWDTDTIRFCTQLPRTTVVPDPAGIEADRFGSTVSGTAMLFDSAGRRLFAGGVTASRGLEGDCVGGDTLQRLLTNQVSGPQQDLPVFGCKLCSPTEPLVNRSGASLPDSGSLSALRAGQMTP